VVASTVGIVTITMLTHLLQSYGYLAVILLVGLESIGIPLPGESTLIAAALFAGATHQLNIVVVVGLVAAAAAIAGDNLGYILCQQTGTHTRFVLKDVECPGEGLLVDESATRSADEVGVGLHRGRRRGVDQVPGLRCERRMLRQHMFVDAVGEVADQRVGLPEMPQHVVGGQRGGPRQVDDLVACRREFGERTGMDRLGDEHLGPPRRGETESGHDGLLIG
jgi:hypothetical protein